MTEIKTIDDLKAFVGALNVNDTIARLRRIYAFSYAYTKELETNATQVIDLNAVVKECASERFSSVVFGLVTTTQYPLIIMICDGRVAELQAAPTAELKELLALPTIAARGKEPPF